MYDSLVKAVRMVHVSWVAFAFVVKNYIYKHLFEYQF